MVITAIAWIGSSFYFIALGLGLHRDRNLKNRRGRGRVAGPIGGGFSYHVPKSSGAPAGDADDLIWFNGKSYSPGSRLALLILSIYLGAEFYLVCIPVFAELANWQAVGISLPCRLGLAGWSYDQNLQKQIRQQQHAAE